jgi:hypothetical protein
MSQFRQPERPHFFTGQLLTADDLQAEQDYFRGKSRLHHRLLHGWGIVSGLGVSIDQGATLVVSQEVVLKQQDGVLLKSERTRQGGLSCRHLAAKKKQLRL